MWQVIVSFIVKYIPVERIVAYVVNKLIERYLCDGQGVTTGSVLERIRKTVEHLDEIVAVANNAISAGATGPDIAGVAQASRVIIRTWAEGKTAGPRLEKEAGIV